MATEPEGRERKLADSFIGFLSEQTDENRRRFELVLETIAEVSASLGEATILESVVDRAVTLTSAERGFLVLRGRRGQLEPRVARDREGKDLPVEEIYSRTVCARVAESGVPVNEAYAPDDIKVSDSIQKVGLRSSMCVPLRVRERVIGVLYVDSRKTETRFTASDLSLFKALAYALALAVEYARVAAKERSLAVAREVQKHLLPSGPHERPGLDIHGLSIPWEELGGDYFDYLELPGDRLGLVVGDVCGHGIPLGLLMATARGQMRAVTALEPDPALALERMNRLIAPDLGDDGFVSVFLGVLEGRSLHYAGAGPCSPLLLRAETGRIEKLDVHGPALGPMPDRGYEVAGPVELEPGDILLLYTDGVTESRDPEGVLFGEERLHEALRSVANRPALGIVEGILEHVIHGREDDLTLVAVKADR